MQGASECHGIVHESVDAIGAAKPRSPFSGCACSLPPSRGTLGTRAAPSVRRTFAGTWESSPNGSTDRHGMSSGSITLLSHAVPLPSQPVLC